MTRPTLDAALLTIALTLPSTTTHAVETLADPGRVVSVTVFQGQALVTREVVLPEGEGLLEAIITSLPDGLMPGSLYAEPGPGVEVRSVRTRVRPVEADDRDDVRELEERLRELRFEKQGLGRRQQLLQRRDGYLNQLESFTAAAGKSDLDKGALDAEALAKLTTLVFAEREEVMRMRVDLQRDAQVNQEEITLLERQLKTLAQGANRSSREAVVFLNKRAGAAKVRLMYLVSGASWSPSYNLRADEDRTTVTVEYNAQVTQMSGEDWSDVEMILSTATPSLVAKAPTLEPLDIRLVTAAREAGNRQSRTQLFMEQKALASNRGNLTLGRAFGNAAGAPAATESASDSVGAAGGFGGVYDGAEPLSGFDAELNSLACAVQVMDLSGRDKGVSRSLEDTESEGISVVYRLPNRTSLPSRSDKQLIQIAALPIEAEFYHVATPVLTSYVYEEARLVNDTQIVLLAGPAATFLGDRFVGRGEAPSVAIGEAFTVGLGINESLRTARELIDKSDRVQGGNRVAQFDYRLSLENFGETAVEVRLTDRLPRSDSDAIKVTLVSATPAMNPPGAPAVSEPTKEGFLRWVLEIPAGATGAEATVVDYTMQIEHDKNLTVAGAP